MHATPEMRDLLFRYDAAAPLEVETGSIERRGDLVRERLTLASINEARVPLLLTYDATTAAPRPLLIVGHGLHSTKDDPRLADLAAAWAPLGFALLSIDAPLHGERSRGALDVLALLARPYTGLRYVVQNAVDLRRAVDWAATRGDLDGGRIGYLGFSMSAFLGVPFVAVDERVRAACFALGGAGLFHFLIRQVEAGSRADQELVAELVDPLHWAGRIAPRPVLQVNSRTDEIVPAALGHMLHGALAEPKRALWFDGAHGVMPDEVIAEMRLFFSDALDE